MIRVRVPREDVPQPHHLDCDPLHGVGMRVRRDRISRRLPVSVEPEGAVQCGICGGLSFAIGLTDDAEIVELRCANEDCFAEFPVEDGRMVAEPNFDHRHKTLN